MLLVREMEVVDSIFGTQTQALTTRKDSHP